MPPPATNLKPLLDALCETLNRLVAAQAQLGETLARQKDAMARGDAKLMHGLAKLQRETAAQIQTLDQLRARTAHKLTGFLDPGAAAPLRIAELAERLPEPDRGRLLVLRQKLTAEVEATRESTAVARTAATALSNHVGCLLQNLNQRQRGGGYTAAGRNSSALSRVPGGLSLSA